MKNMKRSVRRHHYARLKKKWDKKLRRDWFWAPDMVDEEKIEHWVSFYTRTQTVCSCWMCANERKLEGPTLQERKNLLSFEEQIDGL